MYFSVVIIFSCFFFRIVNGDNNNDATHETYHQAQHRLINDLLKKHDHRLAPLPGNQNPMQFNVTLVYPKLLDLDGNGEAVTLIVEVLETWYDPTLAWNPEDYANTTMLVVPKKDFWSLDIGIMNSRQITDTLPEYKQDMLLSSTGQVKYYEPMIVTLWCPLDVHLFPFDSQQCRITFMCYSKSTDMLIFNTMLMEYYPFSMENDEWMVTNLTTGSSQATMMGFTVDMPFFEMSFKRRPTFYVAVIIVPTFFLANMCVMGLYGPKPDADIGPDKVPLSLATLMSMTVLLSIVASEMPRNTFPVLGYYILSEITICASAATLSVVISMVRGGKKLYSDRQKSKLITTGENSEKFSLVNYCKKKNEIVSDYVFSAFATIYDRIDTTLMKIEDRGEKCDLENAEKAAWSTLSLKLSMFLCIGFVLANVAALIYILQYWH